MKQTIRLIPAVLAALLLCGCRQPANPKLQATTMPATSASGQPNAKATATTENYLLVQPEHSETPAPSLKLETGALPQTQTFTNHTSSEGKYDIQAPDNWKKETKGPNLTFTHGTSGMEVQIVKTTEPFTLEAIKGVQLADLVRTGRAVDIKVVTMTETKGGPAVYVEYESNSDPNGKQQYRLENQRYYFSRNGLLAVLTLWAPAGADNGNFWKQIPDTFYWR